MADYTYEQLKGMTVVQLREIATGKEHEALKGFTTMHKDHLLPALCKALGIDAHAHHVAHAENKTKIKQAIRKLKTDRDAAVTAKDYKKLADVRALIHSYKRQLRRTAV